MNDDKPVDVNKLHKVRRCISPECFSCHCTECEYSRKRTAKICEVMVVDGEFTGMVMNWQLLVENAKRITVRVW